MPEFTLDQQSAIEYRRQDTCVTAGPGSGKTTVLVERYRSLIEHHGFEPRNILAITFTEKAAANMKARLAALFEHDPLRLRELESAWVSTIHGFCARLLRDHAIAAGLDPAFAVLDAREAEDLQYSCLSAALDELVTTRREETLDLIRALQTPDLAGYLRSAYDAIRSAGKAVAQVRAMPCPEPSPSQREMATDLFGMVSAWPANLTANQRTAQGDLREFAERLAGTSDTFALASTFKVNLSHVPGAHRPPLSKFREIIKAWAVDRHTAPFRALTFDVFERFEILYQQRKDANGNLDFNDLERHAIELLSSAEEVRKGVRAQFRQVMLDEFQDINQQQAELIDLIRGEDVFFGVGDINQSIYGFRHARPEIFEKYRATTGGSGKHAAELLHNFRSRGEILDCVGMVLNQAAGIEQRPLVAGLEFPSKTEPSIEILKIHAEDKDEGPAREARWIAHRILSLRTSLLLETERRRADFRDFAVLCRNSESMKPILEVFDEANIPYVCGRRQSFLLSREGLDITAFLRTIANPRDGVSLAATLRSPLAQVSDEALLRVRLFASSLSSGLNVLAHDDSRFGGFAEDDARRLRRFIENLKRWRAEQPVVPLDVLIVRVLTDCGLNWRPGTVAADNIESFLALARTRGGQRTLNAFLREIESLERAVSVESDLSDEDQGNCVQVMTAHAAKGLEFPVTIIASMEKGTQRNSAPVTFTPAFGLGLKWRDPNGLPNSEGLGDSWQLHNETELKEREKAEAHRLLYVAMTRAEEHLILSYSRGRNNPSNWAKIVDEAFALRDRPPLSGLHQLGLTSGEPAAESVVAPNGKGFEVAIHITGDDPPPVDSISSYATDNDEPDTTLLISLPQVTNQHDSVVSVTSVTVFADCPRKYYLERYLGWSGTPAAFDPEDLSGPDPGESDELSAAELGIAVHDLLAGKAGTFSSETQTLARVFQESSLGEESAHAIRSGREWEFIVDIDGVLVRGTVDLWFENQAGQLVIVDYKTDTVNAAEASRRAQLYAPQLALYAIAMERAFGRRPAHAWLHFLRPDRPAEVPLHDTAILHVKQLLARLRESQNALEFDLHPGEHCRSCSFYRGMCPAVL